MEESRKIHWSTIVMWVTLLVSWVSTGYTIIHGQQVQDQFITCLTNRLQDRNSYADADRAALKLAFTEVAAATTREQSLAAITKYIQAVNNTDRLREENPIPTSVRACD